MASLATHFSASLFLLSIGLRRLLCSFSLYLKNPSLYQARTWYFSDPKWKNIDLYIVLVAFPLAAFSEFFLFLSLSGHPAYKYSFFQQSVAVLLFWVLIILIICRESIDPFLVPDGFVFVFAGVAFFVEYSVVGNGSTGLASSAYDLFGRLTLVCAGSCLFLSVRPSAFFSEFLLSSGLVFKGTWILQCGLSLYTDTFALKGCGKVKFLPGREEVDVNCAVEDDSLRGLALMNTLFVVHAIVILVASIGLFGLLSWNGSLRYSESSGPLLAQLELENVQMRSSPELEME